MIQLKPFLKTYQNAAALNSLLAPHAFVDEYVFLTKANQVGVLFQVVGIDDECLTEETLANHTKRVSAALRGFSEQFRIYQYVVKQDRAAIDQGREFHSEAVRRTVVDRREHLESKASGLYSLKLYFAVLHEPSGLTHQGTLKRMFSTKKVLRLLAHELERNRTGLMGQASSFERTIGDLLGLTLLGKQDVFRFFRLLCNLDPELADSEHLTTDKHVDYHLASAALSCSGYRHPVGRSGYRSALDARSARADVSRRLTRLAGTANQLHFVQRIQANRERESDHADPHGAEVFLLVAVGLGRSFCAQYGAESRQARERDRRQKRIER